MYVLPVAQFSLGGINKSNCVAASDRLVWMNGQHIQRLLSDAGSVADCERVVALAEPHVRAAVRAVDGAAESALDTPQGRELLAQALRLQCVRACCPLLMRRQGDVDRRTAPQLTARYTWACYRLECSTLRSLHLSWCSSFAHRTGAATL